MPIFLNLQLYSIIHTIQEYCRFIVAYNSIFFCPPQLRPSLIHLLSQTSTEPRMRLPKKAKVLCYFKADQTLGHLGKTDTTPSYGFKPCMCTTHQMLSTRVSPHNQGTTAVLCMCWQQCVLSPWQTDLARRAPQWLQQPWSEHSACPPTDTENNDC